MRKGLKTVIENPNTKSGNYSSKNIDGNLYIYLFGNNVAKINEDRSIVRLSHCGWYSHTTACTLNAIKKYFENAKIILEN